MKDEGYKDEFIASIEFCGFHLSPFFPAFPSIDAKKFIVLYHMRLFRSTEPLIMSPDVVLQTSYGKASLLSSSRFIRYACWRVS
jgi:hypothetical protein